MILSRTCIVLLAASVLACKPSGATTTPQPRAEETRERAWNMRVFATASAKESDFEAMLDALAQADFVLVGETHDDDQTHRLEKAIVEGLVARKPGKVVLSLEMFQRHVQPTIDAYLDAKIDEKAFLAAAQPWPNYRDGYRPMVEAAKRAGVRVVAANLPRDIQQKFAFDGKAALAKLSAEEKALFPPEIHPPRASYWARLESRLRDAGHGPVATADADARTYSVQNLWDNSMAAASVGAHAQGVTVVHVAGAFHVEYGDGIAAQIRSRKPDAKIVTVTIVPVDDLRLDDPLREPERADFIVYALADATGPNAGHLSVAVPSTLRYRLHAPAAGDDARPLLVWLDADGTSTDASLALWKLALGPDVVVAVVEPPHRERAADLRTTGRWAWPDTYADDQARIAGGVEKIVEFVGDRWTIDRARVVIAGVGAGASAALWTGLYGDIEGAHVVAVQPDEITRLGEAGLPSTKPPIADVVVLGEATRVAKATQTLALAKVDTHVEAPQASRLDAQAEALVRRGLKLEAAPVRDGETKLALTVDTPIAWQWAFLHARLLERDTGKRVEIVTKGAEPLAVRPDQFTDGHALPTAPGPFGGTTILVLPRGTKGKERAAWLELAHKDVIKARSRFASLKVVDEAELGATLDAIREAGKRNVLIVPAAFVVAPESMQALQQRTVGHANELTIAWLPGLGGDLARALAEKAEHPEAPAR
jgi:uncharacterized iron-regulated protein